MTLWCSGACSLQVSAKEPAKEIDPYAKEITRHGNVVTVSNAFVDSVRRNSTLVLSRVAIRQRVDKNGRPEACELVEIDKGSSVARMGFKSGDRVTRVNGIPIRDLEGRRSELEGSRRWELVILRQGKPRRIVVEVRE